MLEKKIMINILPFKTNSFLECVDHFKGCIFLVWQLGKCVAQDASPAVDITWLKNNKPLLADGKGIVFLNCLHNGIYRYNKHILSSVLEIVDCSINFLTFCPGISIHEWVQVDPVTGLSTSISVLEYSAEKEDTDAQFSCSTEHTLGAKLTSSSESFTITCESSRFYLTSGLFLYFLIITAMWVLKALFSSCCPLANVIHFLFRVLY